MNQEQQKYSVSDARSDQNEQIECYNNLEDTQICPHKSCLISGLRGFRNGLYYGGQIRFMHQLVMSLLFSKSDQTLKDQLNQILHLTFEHAFNLGKYVFLYKLLVCLQNKIRGKRSKYHALVAGTIVGYFVFGRNKTNVNQQIVLYLISRVVVGGCTNLQKKGWLPQSKFYPMLAGIVWSLVMLLFEDDKSTLQPSLRSSMEFLYKDSDKKLQNWGNLIPFEFPEVLKKFRNN